jgi:hypothetical protein
MGCAADIHRLRAFCQPNKTFFFPTIRDASSEILQQNELSPGGYKEVGITPDPEGYHIVSCSYLGRTVFLRVNRAVGFLMGSPNRTGMPDHCIMERMEVVSNHINGRRSDNYGESTFTFVSVNEKWVYARDNICRNLNSGQLGLGPPSRQQWTACSWAGSRVRCTKPSR